MAVGLLMGMVEGMEACVAEVEGTSGSRANLLHFLFLHKKGLTLKAIRVLLTILEFFLLKSTVLLKVAKVKSNSITCQYWHNTHANKCLHSIFKMVTMADTHVNNHTHKGHRRKKENERLRERERKRER